MNKPVKSAYHYLATFLAGAMLTLSFAPFSYWPTMIIGLSIFIYCLTRSQSPFKTGFVFGLGWFGVGVSWVHVSIADFGGLPLIGSLALMLLLCSYLALFPAFASALLVRFFPSRLWPLALPAIWFCMEWIRSWFLTGFPWISIGYSQVSSPLGGWMPLIGEAGVSILLIVLATVVANGVRNKQWINPSITMFVLFLGGWILNQQAWVTVTGNTAKISMVQGNIKQQLRWVPEQDWPTMQKYLNMTSAHWDSDLIVWPEAAVPKLEPTVTEFLNNLDHQAINTHTGLITGIVNYNFETKQAFNSLIGLGAREYNDDKGHYFYTHTNRYSKHHLLPIGEFIPFESWLRGLAPIFDLPMSSFTRGDYQQQNLRVNGFNLAPALCFEIAFVRQLAANLNEHTDFIVTVSNDAWFGHSHGPAQHLEIAQVRAKEFGIPVLRATNNGITAFINHKGQIQSRLPQFEAAVLSDAVQTTRGYTPYRKLGDLPMWLICIIGFLCAVTLRKRK